MTSTGTPHRVVIIGGGFGGLTAARAFRRARDVQVTLIDRRNFHLFQPLLYQVATAGLSPANIAAPLRDVLKKQRNTTVLMGQVVDIELDGDGQPGGGRVILAHGQPVPFDSLIIATGTRHNYFGNDHWEQHAPGLKTIEDATHIRRRIFEAFETAERLAINDESRKAWLNFVVVGGGPTGVEMAGAIAEISRHTLRGNFRAINPADAKVLLVEGGDRVLPSYKPPLSERAKRDLERLGATVRLHTFVTDVTSDGVTLKTGDDEEILPARTVVWAAGVRASRLGGVLHDRAGATLDRAGRVDVQPDMSVSEAHPNIFVIGDLSVCMQPDGQPAPGIAPTAMQQGRYVTRLIRDRVKAGDPKRPAKKPFRYRDKGIMATIGRSSAVADLGWIRFKGWLGWMAWLFVHLMFIVQFHNRVLVMMQWAWNYFSWNRSARLITGEDHRNTGGTRVIRATDVAATDGDS